MPRIIMTNAQQLKLDADLVEGLLGMRQRKDFSWDGEDLVEDLARVGIVYTVPRMEQILTELQIRPGFRAAAGDDPRRSSPP